MFRYGYLFEGLIGCLMGKELEEGEDGNKNLV